MPTHLVFKVKELAPEIVDDLQHFHMQIQHTWGDCGLARYLHLVSSTRTSHIQQVDEIELDLNSCVT